MQQQLTKIELNAQNKSVSASYLLITKVTKQLISTLPEELLRHAIEIDGTSKISIRPKLHELITPLTYLCLKELNGAYKIHFGFDQNKEFAHITGQFVRVVYKLTMRDHTNIDIEDCVQVDSIITDTAGLIDFTQWKHPSLPVKVIKYQKVKANKETKEETIPN
jgi:hypothetical protein